jgi:leucyl aminopeptidase (aminopeptidase T)
MSWPDREQITRAVLDMLTINLGLKEGEKLLVVSDVPTAEHWRNKDQVMLADMLERAMLAKAVSEIALEHHPGCTVEFYTYPAVGSHGAEPPQSVEERLCQADVVVAITSYSLSHTAARERATEVGVRLASMPTFLARMFAPGGPMAVDYQQVAAEGQSIAGWLTAAQEAVVRTPEGTDMRFSLAGRQGENDHGLYTEEGSWGNLPAGEAYIAPLEGTAEGQIVVPAGWYPELREDMTLRFRDGLVYALEGGGAVGENFLELLKLGDEREPYRSRRNLAELGIGTNPNASHPDNVLEAEKIRGTLHLAIGDNAHMGGTVSVDLHEDFVLPHPDLYLDGEILMRGGELVGFRQHFA